MAARKLEDAFLWGLPVELIGCAMAAADGGEIDSGKIFSPDSSSALALNVFGPLFERPEALQPIPGTEALAWPARRVVPEAKLPFPWHRGRKPNVDVLVETADALIAVECKRYEPFRPKGAPAWSETYWKHDWGEGMSRCMAMRDASRAGETGFRHLDAAQLLKHALGLRTATGPGGAQVGKQPVLVYLHAEPTVWASEPDRAPIPAAALALHAEEAARFGEAVAGDAVRFIAISYHALLDEWVRRGSPQLRAHVAAVRAFFGVGF